jgi:hypothetical protein
MEKEEEGCQHSWGSAKDYGDRFRVKAMGGRENASDMMVGLSVGSWTKIFQLELYDLWEFNSNKLSDFQEISVLEFG